MVVRNEKKDHSFTRTNELPRKDRAASECQGYTTIFPQPSSPGLFKGATVKVLALTPLTGKHGDHEEGQQQEDVEGIEGAARVHGGNDEG